jgi:hypothetical protein
LRITTRSHPRGKGTTSDAQQLYRIFVPLWSLCEWPVPSVLSLYRLINAYQAGEDLEELEEEGEEEAIDEDRRGYDQPSGSRDTGPEAAQGSLARILAESQPSKSDIPLLPRARASSLQRSRTRRRRASVSHGDATVGQAVLMVCHG